ncbi:hypothetical protein [Luteolibacter soli]|uniref:Uncharacterized protein n=1 Tax=Luteolibacter soli TaxID=3135280 RepID=A0ABU9AS22_9BACT
MLVEETFHALFQIPEADIRKDVSRARSDTRSVHEEQIRLRDASKDAKDIPALARSFHLRLCVAAAIYERMPDERGLSFLALACEHVADDATQIHFNKHLAHLDEDDDPKHDDTLYRIHDTVLSTMLERYGVLDVGKLFETDRKEFDILCEIGRHAMGPETLSNPSSERYILQEHGEKGLARIRARVAELRNSASA